MRDPLPNRLLFGSMMLLGIILLLWLDQQIENWSADPAILAPLVHTLHLPDHLAQHGPVMGIGTKGYYHGVGGVGMFVGLMLILPPATRELARLFHAVRVGPYRFISALGSGLLALHAFCTQDDRFERIGASSLAFIIVGVMLLAALRLFWWRQTHDAIHHMAGTMLATLYLGGLGWFLMAIRVKHSPYFDGSAWIVLMILLMVKFTDIGAYFGGRLLGRHKLIPWLSPGKTWEGLFCGVALGALVGMLCLPQLNFAAWKGLIFGGVIGAVGQLGDLLESLMKRDAAVKDSGHLIPGFGGVLDVIDSPLLAAPFAYLLFSIF